MSNGSTIESYPASQRQIRGIGADLLIVDEAAFVPREISTAAYPSIADRVQAGAAGDPGEHAVSARRQLVLRVV